MQRMKKIKSLIYGRTLFVVLAFLVQFALIISTYIYLRDYSMVVYGIFVILGLLVVLHLFNGRENPDLKLVWMLPVLVFPIFGAMFYLYITTQPGTKLIKKRLEKLTEETKEYVTQSKEVKGQLIEENKQMGHFDD